MSKSTDMILLYAVDANWGIGYKNDLLVKISEDLKDFKKLTTGNIIIMGRKTFESLPDSKALPNRINIVITKDESYSREGIEVVNSIEELFEFLKEIDPNNEKTRFVIGGGSIGSQLLPYCNLGYITKIFKSFENVDTTFPNLDLHEDWEIARESSVRRQDDLEYKYVEYKRKG